MEGKQQGGPSGSSGRRGWPPEVERLQSGGEKWLDSVYLQAAGGAEGLQLGWQKGGKVLT